MNNNKLSIDDFNSLSDERIESLFNDENIDSKIKISIVETCIDRINRLPLNIFLTITPYIKTPRLFKGEYKDKFDSLSYDETVNIIYEGCINTNCYLELIGMEFYQKYITYEKENKIGTKLQSFKLDVELYFGEKTVGNLESIGIRLEELLNQSQIHSPDLEELIIDYLDDVISNNKDISFDSNINKIGISIMNYYFQNHIKLNNRLMEFYILFCLKDLNLESICENIVITNQNSDRFGYFQPFNKTLTIFSKYIEMKCSKLGIGKDCDKSEINDLLNLEFLRMISHELGHLVDAKKVEKYIGKNSLVENMRYDAALCYWYKNSLLQLKSPELYKQNHDDFIDEARADLFSVFYNNNQINKYFKDSFSKEKLENVSRIQSGQIIKYYTQKTSEGLKILTPMKKSDNLFEFSLPEEENISISKDLDDNASFEEILENLLLGDDVPHYVLKAIYKISKGKVSTTNIQEEILSTISNKFTQEDIETTKSGFKM